MKRNTRNITVLLCSCALILCTFTVLSFFMNFQLFIVELVLSVIYLSVVFLYFLKYKSYVKSTVKYASECFGNDGRKFLESIAVPSLIVARRGDILWANDLFFSDIEAKEKCIGEQVTKYTNGIPLKKLKVKDKAETVIGDRKYTIYLINFNEGLILFFIDDTEYKEAIAERVNSRPCVVSVNFDNNEELMGDGSKSSLYTQVIAGVEKVLADWAKQSDGLLKKLNNGRYLIIFEERNLQKHIDDKFSVLDKIRDIKFEGNRYATISMGIGRCGKNFLECERWSLKALEMALGRGGDQVVVKNGNVYDFFGGVSKGIEKRDRIRTRIVASMLSDNIKQSEVVFIMGHSYSDLDSIGAALGMWNIIKSTTNIPAFVVTDEKNSLAQPLINFAKENGAEGAFMPTKEAIEYSHSKSLLIIVDTHLASFTECRQLYDKATNVVVIDHHRMMVNHIENASIFYHDPYASSASEMVAELSVYMGENIIKPYAAQAMLSGIMLDTKNFVLKTGVRTFEAAALLKKAGADLVLVKKMFADTMDDYKNKYKVISRARLIDGCAISTIRENMSNIRIVAAQVADEMLSIQGVQASFVLYETDVGIKISARSLGEINVQIIMEKLGGGGHQTMAGADLKNCKLRDAERRLLSEIEKCRSDNKSFVK